MDLVLQSINDVTSAVEGYIPSEIPVPWMIRQGSEQLATRLSPPLFRYGIRYIDLSDPVLYQAIIVILLHPVLWNLIGRFEYKTRALSKILTAKGGTLLFALWILAGGMYRNALVMKVLQEQEKMEELGKPVYQLIAILCIGWGFILVMSSFYQLGVFGTFLGDYFGLLMEERVTAFPFNILEDPMYDGSTLLFTGKAVMAKSGVGIMLSLWVFIVYRFVSIFEGTFTGRIYAEAEKKKS